MGATACGKTHIAVRLAAELNSEIISADSRQVYRNMDIGTGKDIEEYSFDGKLIPYHLIDIKNAGEKYNVYEFQHDFFDAYKNITKKGKLPIMCGGTGLYLESVLNNYNLPNVPINDDLRKRLDGKSIEELEIILRTYKALNNNSDFDTAKRAIRAIEIAEFTQNNPVELRNNIKLHSLNIGVSVDRDTRRERITKRLKQRLENGMIEEVKAIHDNGVSYEDLEYYGLEYKFVAWYLQNKISYEELFNQLNSAIHQFSKRQMTWFRKMERNGTEIHWVDGNLDDDSKIAQIKDLLYKK